MLCLGRDMCAAGMMYMGAVPLQGAVPQLGGLHVHSTCFTFPHKPAPFFLFLSL